MEKEDFYILLNVLILALIWISYGIAPVDYDTFFLFLSISSLGYLFFISSFAIVALLLKKKFKK